MNEKILGIALAMTAKAFTKFPWPELTRFVSIRLTVDLGLPLDISKVYAEHARETYTKKQMASKSSEPYSEFRGDLANDDPATLERYRQKAAARLETMEIDDPLRPSFVKFFGYDPNDKWSQPIGDFNVSQALSKMIKEKGLKPDP